MIQNSLMLNYGIPVLDISLKSKFVKVVLISDFENPNRLNVCGKSGLCKYVFNIKDFNPTFVYSNKEELTLTINIVKSPFIYKFSSEAELDHTYATILGNRYLHYTMAELQQGCREEILNFRTSVSDLSRSIPLMLDSFFVICKYQLSIVKDMSLSSNGIPKHYFESIIRNYYPANDVDNFEHYMKQMGFSDKPTYDQRDLLAFIINHRLECETQESGFQTDVK